MQSTCSSQCQGRKDGPPALACSNACGRDYRFHPVAVLPEARETPKVVAHAGAGDRVKIGGLRHQVHPTARAIRERLRFVRHVLRIAAVEEGGQVHFRPKPADQTPHRPTDTRQRRRIVLRAGQAHGDPERQPIWAELDSNPTTVDPDGSDPGGINANPSNTGDVNLIIRPAKNFDFGERYIVALRNLKDASNQPIQAPIGFQVYRDNEITDQPEVESRRPHMESIINDLTSKAGVDRNSLYMAWDFTVASEDSVTGRATTIRDDAFARLGDTDLADRKIDGLSPDWTITRVLNQGDPIPPGERSLPSQIARRVEGTIEVPCYLGVCVKPEVKIAVKFKLRDK